MTVTLREEMDRRRPRMAAIALTRKGTAIRLFCIECMGGSVLEAKACPTTECRLWPHAYRKQRQGEATP